MIQNTRGYRIIYTSLEFTNHYSDVSDAIAPMLDGGICSIVVPSTVACGGRWEADAARNKGIIELGKGVFWVAGCPLKSMEARAGVDFGSQKAELAAKINEGRDKIYEIG